VNVARASMEELLLDSEDFRRHRRLKLWAPDSAEASAVRSVPRRFKLDQTDRSDRTNMTDLSDVQRRSLYSKWLDHAESSVRANAIICLIHQCNYLWDQQIIALEKQFVTEGGYSEQLAAARLAHRAKTKDRSDQSDSTDPTDRISNCLKCGKSMALRTAKQGNDAGQQFWAARDIPIANQPSKFD
jgi:restriction system protein